MGDVRCEECRGSGIVVEMMMSEFPVPIMCVRCSSTGCPRRGGVMDYLRDRIAKVLSGHPIGSGYYGTNVGADEARDMAQAIIDDLGLRVEWANGREETFQRAVGKWER